MFSLFSRKRKPGWMAVVPNGTAITLSHVVQAAGKRPEIRMLDSFAQEGTELNTLQRLRSAKGLASYACTTLMNRGAYTLTVMDAPSVPLSERKEALRWSLKDMVNYPIDSACLSVLDIPGDSLNSARMASVIVVSASEYDVRTRASIFEEAKIGLDVLDIPELAQRNVAALLEDENRGLAFLSLSENSMMLTLTFKGELVAVRHGEMNFSQLISASEEQKAAAMERLILELQRSLDNFDRQYSYIPVSKVIVASIHKVEKLISELAANIYLPILEMDLSECVDFQAVPEFKDVHFQARNLLALGAALRNEVSL